LIGSLPFFFMLQLTLDFIFGFDPVDEAVTTLVLPDRLIFSDLGVEPSDFTTRMVRSVSTTG
jgi:hypothetical protein